MDRSGREDQYVVQGMLEKTLLNPTVDRMIWSAGFWILAQNIIEISEILPFEY